MAGQDLVSLAPEVTVEIHPALPGVLDRLGSFDTSVDRRVTAGGTSRRSVLMQLEELEQAFAERQ